VSAPRSAIGPRRRRGLTPAQAALTVALITALAAYLRLTHLDVNPSWDGDEGYNLNIVANLAAGHVRMFALQFAFVQHPPLFFVLGAAARRLCGSDLVALRAVAVACGLTVPALLALAGRALGNTRAGLLAAGVFAISPQIVIQNRFAYTYNLLMPLTAAVMLLLILVVRGVRSSPVEAHPAGERAATNATDAHKRRPYTPPGLVSRTVGVGRATRADGRREWRLLTGAALLTGLALATDQEGLYLLPPLLVVAFGWARRRGLAMALVLAALPSALYIGWMLALRPAAFLFDVGHTAGRVGGGSPLVQLYQLAYNFAALLRFDAWIPLGLAGLALARQPRQRGLLLAMVACLLLVVLKVRTPNPLFRTAEPLWPFVALGLGLAGEALARRLAATVAALLPPSWPGATWGRAVVLLTLAPLALVTTVDTLAAARGHFTTPIESALPRSPAAARAMAAWINSHSQPTDLVLAMPQVSWLLHCRTAELLQAVAITGAGTAFYPAGLPSDRWAYDARPRAARYLVVDDFTRAWIRENRAERAIVQSARARWRVVYQGGEYTVYANPLYRRFRLAQLAPPAPSRSYRRSRLVRVAQLAAAPGRPRPGVR